MHVLYGFHSQLIENMKMGVAPTMLTACASLAWKVFRDCIPTKAFLYARGLALNLRCQRCNDEVEDLQHLLFHSSWSVEVWHALEQECSKPAGSLQSNTWREQLKRLRRMGRSVDEDQLRRLCIFLYTSWEIWKQQNDWIFNGE